jgi:hypothetical protein
MADKATQGMSSADAHSANATTGPLDVSSEDTFWRENYASRPYVAGDRGYDYYRPAFQYGWEAAARNYAVSWVVIEPDLRSGWEQARGRSTSTWEEMKHAIRDAWNRVVGRTESGAKREMGHMNPDTPR